MSETNVATVEAPVKATKVKKPVVKTSKKSKEEIKTGPSVPQLRILTALAKADRPLSKSQLSAKSNVHLNWIAEYIGGTAAPVSDLVRGRKKLVAAGLVRIKEIDVDGSKERLYEITATGKKAVKAVK